MKKISFIIILIINSIIALSQNVMLDSNFGNSGIVITANTTEINKSVILPNGSIISAGYKYESSGTNYHLALSKYNSDGTIYNNFGTNGLVNTIIGYTDEPYSLIIQPDLKILVAGSVGFSRSFIARYNQNGYLDNTFGNNGVKIIDLLNNGTACNLYYIALLPNNQIIAGGNTSNGATLSKFNSNGSLDSNFGNNGFITYNTPEFNYNLIDLKLLSNGTILTCGSGYTDSINHKVIVANFNTDGIYNNSFGVGGKVIIDTDTNIEAPAEACTKIKELNDNKIILGGYSNNRILIKLLANGLLDSSFATNGVLYHSYPFKDIAIQANGKIIICGTKNLGGNLCISTTRFNSNGTLDSSFNSVGFFDLDISSKSDLIQSINLQSDNKILISGASSVNEEANFTLARLLIDQNISVNEYRNDNEKIIIYPNPIIDKINVFSKDYIISEISIYNCLGKIISKSIINDYNCSIKIDAPKGFYLCSIKTKQGTIHNIKLIKN